jgi:exopolyphosphatase/guanosine-5'-triphosphate,3'-diphosphate pyrophosphatase
LSARRICAIDVGTNTMLGLIVERAGGAPRVLDDVGAITRLGRGVDARGELAADAIDRALRAMTSIVERARALGAEEIVAVGTSAVRDARNRDALVARARANGVALEPIDGAREAALTFAGARPLLEPIDEALTVIDVGGGSTEIAIGHGRALRERKSLDVGSVRLFERHLHGDPPTDAQRGALIADVDRAAEGTSFGRGRLVALAGTACTVGCIAHGIDPFDARAVHGRTVEVADLRSIAARLGSMRIDERRRVPGVPEGREDVVAAGALVLLRLAERAGAERFEVSDGGVRWGLALEILAC